MKTRRRGGKVAKRENIGKKQRANNTGNFAGSEERVLAGVCV